MNRTKTIFSSLVLIAMLVAVPQLAYSQKNDGVRGSGTEYRVVINHEEQYSIWMADQQLPKGWRATNFVGSKAGALQHIEEVWTDMRPLSKRKEIAIEIYKQHQRKK